MHTKTKLINAEYADLKSISRVILLTILRIMLAEEVYKAINNTFRCLLRFFYDYTIEKGSQKKYKSFHYFIYKTDLKSCAIEKKIQ
ncbi:hypothetical protein [Elizabethkingia argenteiflava]|uniref:hypothetical protein n=1 Tax=Elizabethkingia argenteiflava TaxID=2681556 RepID=UPI0014121E29|nr:hypothetical protein [Elizabethkingia argenteiflava]